MPLEGNLVEDMLLEGNPEEDMIRVGMLRVDSLEEDILEEDILAFLEVVGRVGTFQVDNLAFQEVEGQIQEDKQGEDPLDADHSSPQQLP
jgi:hypothetical protein